MLLNSLYIFSLQREYMADGYLVENYSTISRILFSYVFDRVHICKGNLNAYETRQQLELNLMVALKLEIIS